MIGTSLSHYRITEKLGQGAMGEVYRVEDTNLSRQVAIKVLPDEFAHNTERLARFEREARLVTLNHPRKNPGAARRSPQSPERIQPLPPGDIRLSLEVHKGPGTPESQ